jgi:uncharacterized membrane protein
MEVPPAHLPVAIRCCVTSRTARFALAGAAIVGTAAFSTSALCRSHNACTADEDTDDEDTVDTRTSPWAYVLGFELSPTEAVIWFIVLEAIAGAFLGAVFALLRQRRDSFMLVGAILGGVLGLGYNASLDESVSAAGTCSRVATARSSDGRSHHSRHGRCGPRSELRPGRPLDFLRLE